MFEQFQQALASGKFGDIIASTIGQIITVVVALVLLLAVVGFGNHSKKMKTKELVYSAIAIAIAVVLSYIKLLDMPQGGSITLGSMLFIVLIGYWFGPVQGIICGMTYGLLQVALGGYVMHPVQLILDFPVAFGMLGLSGFFKNAQSGLMKGLVLGAFGRFVFHVLSGVIFFADYAPEGIPPMVHSISYNIAYIAGEVFITCLILMIPQIAEALKQLKKMATS